MCFNFILLLYAAFPELILSTQSLEESTDNMLALVFFKTHSVDEPQPYSPKIFEVFNTSLNKLSSPSKSIVSL